MVVGPFARQTKKKKKKEKKKKKKEGTDREEVRG